MDTNTEVFGNNSATTGTHLRCAFGIDEHHQPTSVCSFVGSELHELTPSHISNAPADRLVAIDLHISNIQVFKRNELVFVDQLARFLMSEVATAIGRTFVSMTERMHNLAPFGAVLRKQFLLTLQTSNIPFVLLHPTLASDLLTITQVGKGGQSKIDANNLGNWRQRLNIALTGKTRIPVANRIPPNGKRLDLPANWAMQLDLYSTNLGKRQLIAHQLETRLRKSEGVISITTSKTRIANLFFTSLYPAKESLKRQIDTRANLLQHLGMYDDQRRILRFPLQNHADRIVATYRPLLLFPSILSSLKRFIIKPTTSAKCFLKACSLGASREKPVFISQAHRCIVA